MRLCPTALLNCRKIGQNSVRTVISVSVPTAPRKDDELIKKERGDIFRQLLSGLDKAMLNNDRESVCKVVTEYQLKFPHSMNHNFLNKAIEAFMRVSQTDRARELFKSAVNDGFRPNERTMIVLIDGMLRHADVNRAKEVMQSLEAFGVKPTIKIINLWISHYLKEHQLAKARSLFVSLEEKGLTPNSTTFLNFIRFFMKSSDFQAAEKIKAAMFKAGISPNVNFYNTILQLLFQKQALAEVESILAEMEANSVKADEKTFNVLIEGYSSVNMLDKAQDLIRQMSELGFKPSIVTFNRLLASQAYALDVHQTKTILEQMNDLGLEFNAFTYAALFKNLVAKQKYPEAVSMLFRMEESGVAVPVEIFSNLIKLCCDSNLDPAVYLLRTQLIKHDLSTSAHVYTVLIKYYLRHRNYAQVDGLLLEMQRTKNMPPGLHVFGTLLNHYVEHLEIDRIKQILKQMSSLKLELNSVIFNIVMKAYYVHCKCLDGGIVYRSETARSDEDDKYHLAEPVSGKTSIAKIRKDFEDTFGIPFQPSILIFNDLMSNFFYSGRYNEALECFDEILACDLTPNLSSITTLIKAHLYLGQIEEAKAVLKKIPAYGLRPSTLQCALVHHFLCRQLRTEEAEQLMLEIGSLYHNRINYVFYSSLIYAYSRRFDHFNVFRTFERLRSSNFRPDTETCNYILMSMFQVGQYQEAHNFFHQMIAEGTRRNNYTYSIMSDREFMNSNTEQIEEYLADCTEPGNTIDAYPFQRLLRLYYEKGEMHKVAQLVNKMCNFCVRFTWEVFQYISVVFYRCIDSCEDLPFARKLLEKTLIDLEPIEAIDDLMVDSLRKAYRKTGDTEELESFNVFLTRLPELREKITQISPSLRERIEAIELRKNESRLYRSEESEIQSEAQAEVQAELDLLTSQAHDIPTNSAAMDEFIFSYLKKQ